MTEIISQTVLCLAVHKAAAAPRRQRERRLDVGCLVLRGSRWLQEVFVKPELVFPTVSDKHDSVALGAYCELFETPADTDRLP